LELHESDIALDHLLKLESLNLRLFYQEINKIFPECTEVALVQRKWITWERNKYNLLPLSLKD
jgi:hypothetical protein